MAGDGKVRVQVAFTGSTEFGSQVMRGAAGTVKRVTLELGGKSANVGIRGREPREGRLFCPHRRLR